MLPRHRGIGLPSTQLQSAKVQYYSIFPLILKEGDAHCYRKIPLFVVCEPNSS